MSIEFLNSNEEEFTLRPPILSDIVVTGSTYGKTAMFNGTVLDVEIDGWKNLQGDMKASVGAKEPAFSAYASSGIRQFKFAKNKEIYGTYKLPHDYVPGTDLFMTTHWSSDGTSIGKLFVYFNIMYSDGLGSGTFGDGITVASKIIVKAKPDITTILQPFTRMTIDIPISSAVGDVGKLFANSIFGIDGILIVRIKRPNVVNDTYNQNPFFHYTDIRYKSNNSVTKNKTPPFY